MAYVYRYIDKADSVIKYVGIVWGDNRTLEQRIYEHLKKDDWCINGDFEIEYINEDIDCRTDAEYFESHYISLFQTDKWFNVKKSGWGVSKYLPNRDDWKKYVVSQEEIKKHKELRIKNGREQQIEMACEYANIDKTELAHKFGCTSIQAFNQRLKTGKFTQEELEEIANILNAEFVSCFKFPDGTMFSNS